MQLGCMTISVKDVAASQRFYQNILGMAPVDAPQAFAALEGSRWLSIAPGKYLQLAPLPTEEIRPLLPTGIGIYPRGFHHICLEVTDIEAFYRWVCQTGWPLERQLLQGTDRNWQFWLRDPDGYPVELMQMSTDSLQHIYRGDAQ